MAVKVQQSLAQICVRNSLGLKGPIKRVLSDLPEISVFFGDCAQPSVVQLFGAPVCCTMSPALSYCVDLWLWSEHEDARASGTSSRTEPRELHAPGGAYRLSARQGTAAEGAAGLTHTQKAVADN